MNFSSTSLRRKLRPGRLLIQFPRLFALLPAALLVTACETDIDVPEPEHTPRVALSMTLDNLPAADSVKRLDMVGRIPFVSVSQRLYDLTPLMGSANATLEVRDAAGTVVERYKAIPRPANTPPYYNYYGQGRYRPVLFYQFQPGQTYTVRASVPGIEPAESQLTMPEVVPVQAGLTELSNDGGQIKSRLTVAFDDPGATTDYYIVTVRIAGPGGSRGGYLNIERNDQDLPGGSVSPYQLTAANSTWELYPFSDANVNGQRISFSGNIIYQSSGNGGRAQYLEVTLSHLTRDQYLFYNSYLQYQDNNGNPFAEPTPLYSNLTPGFGIFGAATDAVATIRL